MLSKAQAKTFFIGGTLLFSGVFLWLTVDTVSHVSNSKSNKSLTAEVVRGKQIWDDNNCMGCHTIFGEGAYYAPELTRVIERRGEQWIRLFIKDPEAMFPGQRKMVKYEFTAAQTDDLIAFLRWIGEVDLNGFPAKPPLKDLAQPVVASFATSGTSTPTKAQPQFVTALCLSCHSIDGKGAQIGPALDDAYARKNREEMLTWLRDPQSVKPGTTMPKMPLTEEQIVETVDYLQSFGGK